MFWIDAVLMLICGWMGGVISTLVLRYVLEGRKPLDRRMLPEHVPALALPPLPPLPAPPEFSPYAPKAKGADLSGGDRSEAIKRVWRAAKKERSPHWNAAKPPEPRPPRPPPPQPPEPIRPAASTSLLPTVPWGG